MRVLHVTPYIHPNAGGPPVVVEQFVRACQDRGAQSEVLSTPLFCANDALVLLERWNSFAPTSFVPQSLVSLLIDRRSRECIRARVRNADIVHIHTLWQPLNALVRMECVRQGRPYVLMPHGMLDPYSLSVRGLRKALYLLAVERRSLRLARRTIFTTDEEVRLAKLQPCALATPVVIPLGGDAPPGDRPAMARTFLESFPRAKGRRLVLFLGRLHIKKGLDRILDAWPHIMASCPEAMLVIAGDGETSYRAELQLQIQSRGMDGSVLMTGRLDGMVKWGAYAASSLFALPSRQENFAITVAEAMHMGLPVIISDKVNTWPYVTQAEGGVVLEERALADGLPASISTLLRDEEMAESMGRRARKFAQENLSWGIAGDRLMRCYVEVLEEVASAGGYRAAHAV